MKSRVKLWLPAVLVLTGLPLAAQTTANPVSKALKASLARSSRIMVAAAQEMPANKFNYKPTAESMSFGQLTLHVATSNQSMCHWLTGAPAAPKTTLTATSSKADLVALLQSSFEYCTSATANLDDAHLGDPVDSFGGRKMSQAQLMMTLSDDWSDHYSQQAGYLRLNGLLPPTAQPRQARGR